MSMTRRSFTKLMGAQLAGGALAGSALAAPFVARAQSKPTLVVTEPVHGIAYLPLYVAVAKNMFEPEGFDVKVLLIESGSGHTNAVLSGQAFAFIGGPEHNAIAELKGAQIRAVANVVDRNNNYMVAAKGLKVDPKDPAATYRGKTVATGFYGGTPNSTTRWIMADAGLKPGEDVKLIETSLAGTLAAVKSGQAQFAMVSEPILTQGIRQGIWGEPFWSGPKFFGSYAYSALNVRKDTIDKDPKTVAGFVRGVMKGLQYTYDHPKDVVEVVKQMFPTMPTDDMQATLDRCFADQMWSKDAQISQQAWQNAQRVVLAAGVLKQEVAYETIIDPQFMKG